MAGNIRPGTGKIVKFFKSEGESMTKLKDECAELSDQDLADLAGGIEDETLTY